MHFRSQRRVSIPGALLLLLAVFAAAACMPATLAEPYSETVSSELAQQQLGELVVAEPTSKETYDRALFPHWITVLGACDTRETVLQQQGMSVRTDDQCKPVEGSWRSPYDDAIWTWGGAVDIDHVVPLANAWISGAAAWNEDQRRQFANDLINPQLRAVTDKVNQAKGDKSPDAWKPPSVAYWPTYAAEWIAVKHYYKLTVTLAERDALASMLR